MSAAGDKRPGVIVAPDPDGVAAAAAALVREAEAEAIARCGRFFVALAGGATPRRLYETLAQAHDARFDAWNVFFGDERWVPAGHRDSNARMAREALLGRVPIPARQVHPVATGYGAPREAARLYEWQIRRVLAPAPGRLPRFDVVLLGLGADGHTASLFPGSTAVAAAAGELVVATWAPGPGAWRVTLTAALLNAARRVIFVVTGEDKAGAVVHAVSNLDPAPVPAAAIRPTDGQVVFVLDRAAASRLALGRDLHESAPLRLLSFD